MKVDIKTILIIFASSIALGILSFFIFKINDNRPSGNWSTNHIELTNYVVKEKPKYVYVNLTKTNVVESTNENVLTSNIILLMTPNDYSNLLVINNDYSNYSQSLIYVTYSNGYLILQHYQTTNVIKLPYLLNSKDNILTIGYSLNNQVIAGYNRILIKDLNIPIINQKIDLSIGGQTYFSTNSFNASANILIIF